VIGVGSYVVNGEVVDVREERPTAHDLKLHVGKPLSDWVMAQMPDGQVVKLNDSDILPSNADHFAIVVAHSYG
jgi:hypothetical protein